MHPQERASGLPLIEYTPSKKPLSGTVVMSFACDVMIGGWLWGREPSKKAVSELIPCEAVCHLQLLRRCHLCFFSCQFIQSLQAILDLFVSHQLLQVPF